MNPPEDGTMPARIGPYKVLELLGHGGMGEVYLAEQTEPVKRRVAVKVIRHGLDTKVVLARFETERQALAIMDHPSIAKVLDAGITEGGRPYFVMEHVRGVPITEYCDLHKLPTPERLELFLQLCQAVQHAHQKGVIHRDLKPSNVLVTVPNGRPVSKVIDFGIAKAMGYKLTERTLHTEHGQPIGTPGYMSPEQAEATSLDVDTRTDVYSLGVMLYELLVGTLPIDMREVRPAAVPVALRESDPPKPSARLNSLGDRQATIARLRQTDPGSLRSAIRGDLDWIVMKALEKDRTRRYETVNGLALDIRRHLRDEPVLAGSPSAGYRIRKFARRHRLGVTAVAAIAAGLIGGAVLATIGMVKAQRSGRIAAAEAAAASQVADFLEGLFEVSDPGEARGNTITVREILDQGAERIHTELTGQPITQARLMNSIGNVYESLGLFDEAEAMLTQAVELREEEFGPDHLDVATSLNNLGNLYWRKGRYDDAEPLLQRALEIRERVLGPDHTDVAVPITNLANVYKDQGRPVDAERLYERALEIRQKSLGPEHADVIMGLGNLASLYSSQGKYDEAEPLLLRVLEIRERVLDADHPDLAPTLNNLGFQYWRQGRYEEAEPLYLRGLAIDEKTLGPDHPYVALDLNNLAALYQDMQRYAAAEPLHERALEIRERMLAPDHPDIAQTLANFARLYVSMERYAEAEPLYERALAIFEQALGPDHPNTAVILSGLARLYFGQERYAEAESFNQRALSVFEEQLGPDHVRVAGVLANLANVYREQGRPGEAEPLYVRSLTIRDKAVGPDHPSTARILEDYALLLREIGRPEEADSLAARAAAIRASEDSAD